MIEVGEVRAYLQDKVESELNKVETQLKLLSKQNAVEVRTNTLDLLKELNAEMLKLVRNAHKNKNIPVRIPANIGICQKDLVGLRDDTGRKILSSLNAAEGEAVKIKLLADLKDIRKKIDFVISMLVSLEKEGKKSNN